MDKTALVKSYAGDSLDRILKYRATLRGFDLAKVERIIRHSSERYLDTETGRSIVVGRHDRHLVMLSFEFTHE